MIQLDNMESLSEAVTCTDSPIFYVFHKRKEQHRFLDKYTVWQFAHLSDTPEKVSVLFDTYDIYKLESMEEYQKLVYLNELIS